MVVLVQAAIFLVLCLSPLASANTSDQPNRFVFERDDRTIVLEPFGPNIVRVTLSSDKGAALGAPGYGIIATPSMTGWTHEQDSAGYDTIRSARITIRVAPKTQPPPQAMPLDDLNQSLRKRYFYGDWGRGTFNDSISVSTTAGKPLLTMWRWSMVPNAPGAAANNSTQQRRPDAGYHVSATFDSPSGEHYYGLGQQQQGFLDLRDHQIKCWHDYAAVGGENVCVPFLVSSRGYGLIWDNPSKTTIDLAFNQQNVWSSEIGDRVSFFVIAGDKTDEIYQGYRQLTGVTHMLPRATYGYIQSKAIYPTQEQLLEVAKGYKRDAAARDSWSQL